MKINIPGEIEGIGDTFIKYNDLKEYTNGEFCKSVGCDKKDCSKKCVKTAYEFHGWLIKNKYKILKKVEKLDYEQELKNAFEDFYTKESLDKWKEKINSLGEVKTNGKKIEEINKILVPKKQHNFKRSDN